MNETLPYGIKGTIDRPSVWTPEYMGWFVVVSLVVLLVVFAILKLSKRKKTKKSISEASPEEVLVSRAKDLTIQKNNLLTQTENGLNAETMPKVMDYCSETNLLLREFCGFALNKNAKDMTTDEFERTMSDGWKFPEDIKFNDVVEILRLTDRIRFGGVSDDLFELIKKQSWDAQIQQWFASWKSSQSVTQISGATRHEP